MREKIGKIRLPYDKVHGIGECAMDGIGFESAIELQGQLRRAVTGEEWLFLPLPDDQMEALFTAYMPEAVQRVPRNPRCGCLGGVCIGRCDRTYWIEHANAAQRLMEAIARWAGWPTVRIFGQIGFLHDLDYMKFPHDAVKGRDWREKHPVPLLRDLRVMGWHPVACLAVLEHAPYLGLEASSRVSDALAISEDLATMASAYGKAALPAVLPPTIVEAFPYGMRRIDVLTDKGRFRHMAEGVVTRLEKLVDPSTEYPLPDTSWLPFGGGSENAGG